MDSLYPVSTVLCVGPMVFTKSDNHFTHLLDPGERQLLALERREIHSPDLLDLPRPEGVVLRLRAHLLLAPDYTGPRQDWKES